MPYLDEHAQLMQIELIPRAEGLPQDLVPDIIRQSPCRDIDLMVLPAQALLFGRAMQS